VERAVGLCKQCCKYRLTSCPEKVIAGYYLMRRRILELGRVIALPVYPSRQQRVVRDEFPPAADHFLMQSGTKLLALLDNERADINSSVQRMGLDFAEAGSCEIVKLKAAFIGGEIVQSKAYTLVKSRESFNVSVQFLHPDIQGDGGVMRTRYGIIHYFLRLEHEEKGVLRLAKLTLFVTKGKEGRLKVIDHTRPYRENVFIRLEDINRKVLLARHKLEDINRTYVLPVQTSRKL
jgi:hypothetical protein